MSSGGESPISSSTPGCNAYIPALTRLLTGRRGFSTKPTTRRICVELNDAARRWLVGAKHRQRRRHVAGTVEVDERREVEVGEVVGVACEEKVLAIDPIPMRHERARAAEELRLKRRPDDRRRSAFVDMLRVRRRAGGGG